MKSLKHGLLGLALILSAGCSSKSKAPVLESSVDTLPRATLNVDTEVQNFAFSSCAHQRFSQPIWNQITKDKPQFFIAMGDNVYASRPEDQPILKAYELQSQLPEYRNFSAQIPVLAIWDDHDFGQNDGGKNNPLKAEAKKDFLRFYPDTSKWLKPDQEGLYYSTRIGKTLFVFLDTRWFRDDLVPNPQPKTPLDKYIANPDPNVTLLGDSQWAWLTDLLSNSDAKLLVLVSSIQVIPEEHGFEKWANFPHERKRLLNLLEKSPIKNVVVLSGDRHVGEISRLRSGKQIVEITASSINRPSQLERETNKYRIHRRPYPKENFGWLEIDWKKNRWIGKLKNQEGQIIQQTQGALK